MNVSVLSLRQTLATSVYFCSQSPGSSSDWDYNKTEKTFVNETYLGTLLLMLWGEPVLWQESLLPLVMWLWRCGIYRVEFGKITVKWAQLLQVSKRAVQESLLLPMVSWVSMDMWEKVYYLLGYGLLHFILLKYISILPGVWVFKKNKNKNNTVQ